MTLPLPTLVDVKTLLSRVLMSLGCLVAVVASTVVLATPADAATFTTRCVVAREMRIYHTSTSSQPGRTKLYFGTTVYKDKRAHGRIRVYWWTLTEGWHRGWISANPNYTRLGACGTIT
jgi:hypothetical protein